MSIIGWTRQDFAVWGIRFLSLGETSLDLGVVMKDGFSGKKKKGTLRNTKVGTFLLAVLIVVISGLVGIPRTFAQEESVTRIQQMRSVESLVPLLKDQDDGKRMEAAIALGKLGDPQAVDPLVALLKEEQDAVVLEKAIVALGELHDQRAVEPLIQVLQDGAEPLASFAAAALSKMKSPQAIESLIPLLDDPIPEVRMVTATALGQMGWSPSSEEEKASYCIARQDWLACEKLGAPVVNPLIVIIDADDVGMIGDAAARVLGKIKDPRAIKPLVNIVSRSDFPEDAASKALVEYGASAVDPLLDAFKDARTSSRGAVARALGTIGDKKVIPVLVSSLQDWEARDGIANALYALGWQPGTEKERVYYLVDTRDKSCVKEAWESVQKILLEDVGAQDEHVINYALYAFIEMGREEIISKLVDLLKSKGTKIMAEAYLNCGHKVLAQAAEEWAAGNGYDIRPGGGNAPARWGAW